MQQCIICYSRYIQAIKNSSCILRKVWSEYYRNTYSRKYQSYSSSNSHYLSSKLVSASYKHNH